VFSEWEDPHRAEGPTNKYPTPFKVAEPFCPDCPARPINQTEIKFHLESGLVSTIIEVI